MDNPKYIQVMRQVASDFDGISHELFQVASDLERMDQYNPQQKLFSLVRSAEVSSVIWMRQSDLGSMRFSIWN